MPFGDVLLALIACLVLLIVGPWLDALIRKHVRTKFAYDRFILIAAGGFVVLHIFPESLATMGVVAFIPLLLGVCLPIVVEHTLHDGTRQMHLAVLALIVFGVGLHTFFDGFALSLPSQVLPIGIVLHRFPESVLVWQMLRGKKPYAYLGLVAVGIAIISGYTVGRFYAEELHGSMLAAVQAFIAGSLLHVMFHGGKKHRHESPSPAGGRGTKGEGGK